MKNVMKCELYRLSKAREVWAMGFCLVAIQVLIVIGCAITSHIEKFSGMGEAVFGAGFFDDLPSGCNSMIFRALAIVMVASLATKLYQTGVIKQLVSCGIPRRKLVIGQFFAFSLVFCIIALISAVATGFRGVIVGGSFTLTSGSMSRLWLAMIGMLLVVMSMCSVYLFVSHLTGSISTAIIVGLLVDMGLPSVISGLSFFVNNDFLSKYTLDALQSAAVAYDPELYSLGRQVTGMVGLVVFIVILLVLTIVVVDRKEIK